MDTMSTSRKDRIYINCLNMYNIRTTNNEDTITLNTHRSKKKTLKFILIPLFLFLIYRETEIE